MLIQQMAKQNNPRRMLLLGIRVDRWSVSVRLVANVGGDVVVRVFGDDIRLFLTR